MAIYHEPAGPCVTRCFGKGTQPIRLSEDFSLQLLANSGKPVAEVFRQDLPRFLSLALLKFDGVVQVRGRFNREGFIRRLMTIVSGEHPPDAGSASVR